MTTPENVKYNYTENDSFDAVLEKIIKISELKLKCALEVNFNGSGDMTAKITKLSSEDTDRLLAN